MEQMNYLHKIDRFVVRFTTGIAMIGFVAIMVMMLLTTVDVIGRTLTKTAIKGCYEYIEFTMAAAVFSSLAYTQAKREHVHITMVIAKFPGRVRFACYAVMSLISSLIIAVITWATANQAMRSFSINQVTSVLHFPYMVCYGFESIMMFFFFLTLLYDAIKNCIAIFYTPLAEEIQGTWS